MVKLHSTCVQPRQAGAAALVEIPREVHGRRGGGGELRDDGGEQQQARAVAVQEDPIWKKKKL
jgi:hypothetical protein